MADEKAADGANLAAVTELPEALRAAVQTALDHVVEWEYEDRGHDYSQCPSCGWNTKDDRTQAVPMGHKPGCELESALDFLESLGFSRR